MAKKFKSFGSVVAFRVIFSMAVVLIATFLLTNYILVRVMNENYDNLLSISIDGIKWDISLLKKQLIKEAKHYIEKKISPSFLDYIVEDGTVVYNGTNLPDGYVEKMAKAGSSGDLAGIPFWNVENGGMVAGVVVDEVILKRLVRSVRGNGFVIMKVGKALVIPYFLKGTEIEEVVRRGGIEGETFLNDQRYFYRSFPVDGMTVYTFLSATVYDDVKLGLVRTLALSFAVGIAVIAYISHLIARYLSRNLRMILDGFEKLREGSFEFLDIQSHDELGMIMGEFNVTVAVLKDAMEKMKMAKEMAEEASRTKSMFLASVSHEIRNPLNSILGFTELLLNEETDPKKREYLMTIYRSGEHLLNVINDILDLSKIEAGKMELVYEVYNPKKLVEEVVQMYQPQAMKKGIEIFAEIEEGVPDKAVADPFRVKQILINLVSNAVKFTDEGYVKIKLSKDGDYLLYVVEDTGIGIPKEKLEKIFEPFTQADATVAKKYGGTGLGLSISKRLAQMMKGDLWMESEVGKGTKVYLKIPIKVIGEEEISKLRRVKNERLAIIALDDEELKNGVREFLEGLGFEVELKGSLTEVKEEVEYVEPRLVVVSVEKTSDAGGKLREIPTIAILPPGTSKIKLKSVLFLPGDYEVSEVVEEIIEFLGISMKEEISVAIVDDNEVNRVLVSKMLDRIARCSKKMEFEDGVQIVEAVESGEEFDVILMDVQMPNMDGYEACKRIKEMEFDGKIILATGSTGQDAVRRAEEAGCDEMVPKPIKIEDLRDKLWRYFPKAVAGVEGEKEKKEEEVEEKTEEIEEVVSEETGEGSAEERVDVNSEEAEKILEGAIRKLQDMGMDREVATGMVQDYVRFLRRKLKSLKEAIIRMSEQGVRKVAHDLVGSGEMYGFDEVSEMGRKMSQLMNSKDFDGVVGVARELEEFIMKLERALKSAQAS